MPLLSADMQRRPTPAVCGVHLSPQANQVLHNEMLIGSHSNLESTLAVVLFNIQHVQGSHLPCKNIGEGSTALGHSDVEEAAGKRDRVTPPDMNQGSRQQRTKCTEGVLGCQLQTSSV